MGDPTKENPFPVSFGVPDARQLEPNRGLARTHRCASAGRLNACPVSAADVEELQRAIESVLKPLSLEEIKKVHLKATNRWRVPVSFDDNWRPFLNWTKGYHHPRELRLYFDLVPRVLRVAEEWFRPVQSPRSGGRVFIDERGIHCDGPILLGTLEWPAGVVAASAARVA